VTDEVKSRGPWWPMFLAGFCGPLLGRIFGRWVPPYLAMGFGFFVAWSSVSLVWSNRLRPRWNLPPLLAALLAGAAGSLCVALLYFLFPDK
jgi:predicted branched-subunit amino acid permease